jgi:hypothetical protein
MPTAAELLFAEQFNHLSQVAVSKDWDLKRTDGLSFILGLPARDGSRHFLKAECDDLQGMPPAWHWYNPEAGALDAPADTPKGSGGYFHSSGRICAPWNRLAYKSVDSAGPHGDWELSNWTGNPQTGACTTLSAMALRIAIELDSSRYAGRMA